MIGVASVLQVGLDRFSLHCGNRTAVMMGVMGAATGTAWHHMQRGDRGFVPVGDDNGVVQGVP